MSMQCCRSLRRLEFPADNKSIYLLYLCTYGLCVCVHAWKYMSKCGSAWIFCCWHMGVCVCMCVIRVHSQIEQNLCVLPSPLWGDILAARQRPLMWLFKSFSNTSVASPLLVFYSEINSTSLHSLDMDTHTHTHIHFERERVVQKCTAFFFTPKYMLKKYSRGTTPLFSNEDFFSQVILVL